MRYYINIDQNQTKMTQTTPRPTATQLQRIQARKDRKAAAAERRQNDYRNDTGFKAIYAHHEYWLTFITSYVYVPLTGLLYKYQT